jgi:hypothetical protein
VVEIWWRHTAGSNGKIQMSIEIQMVKCQECSGFSFEFSARSLAFAQGRSREGNHSSRERPKPATRTTLMLLSMLAKQSIISENKNGKNQTCEEGDMDTIYNVYCDESCHLERDRQPVMVLGAVWCPLEKSREISVRIREIKTSHALPKKFESKWTKVSSAKQAFYVDLLNYFFDDDDLHFRALIVPDKTKLQHELYGQDHDTWYYKMYFDMLKVILDPKACYRIYVDIKDTRSADKIAKLHDVLCNNIYDFERKIIERVQTVRSHEVEPLQLTDLLVGVVSYVNRGLTGNASKVALVERMRERSGYDLTRTNLLRESKVNLFVWQATETQE